MTTPYFADDHVALYLGDFRKVAPLVLETLPDLVVADPPYNETSLGWDRWPKGWPSCVRGCSMWCFGSTRMFLKHGHELSAAGWHLSQDVVWRKHNGSNSSRDRFRRVHEIATHWYRGPWADVYHEPPVTMDAVEKRVHRRERPPQWGEIGGHQYASEDGGPRLMTSVIEARSAHGSAINETEKPVGLVTLLVSYGCPPGGLVVDLFAGSCSTLVAARALGMRAVGFELREEQCEKAARRLAQGDLFSAVADG